MVFATRGVVIGEKNEKAPVRSGLADLGLVEIFRGDFVRSVRRG